MARYKPRVLVVEDDTAIRTAVSVSLEGEGYEVTAVPDGSNVESVVADFRPDVLVLDVRLPVGPNGFDLARSLRRWTDAPLVYLTAADSLVERLEGFNAGADDYLTKPFDIAELLVRVKALLRRAGRLSTSVRRVGDVEVDEQRRIVTRAGTEVVLTPTEYEVLAVLFRHAGQALSKYQLLNQLWGFEGYGVNVVEVHVSALRHKLEALGPRVIHTVRGIGYVARG